MCGLVVLLLLFASCEKTSYVTITVTNIVPSEARIGDMVQVIGTGFSNIKRPQDSTGISGVINVYFEGVEVTGIYVDDTSISVTVPPGIPSGPICIKYEGKDYCSPVPFTVIASNPIPNSYMHLNHHPGANNNVAASVQAGNNIYVGFINWWKYTVQKDIWTPRRLLPIKFQELRTLQLVVRVTSLEEC